METETLDNSNTSSDVNETHREASSQIITNEPIPNTPFRLIGNPTQGYALAIGNHRLTEPKRTTDEAIEELDNNMWNIIANMIVAIEETYRIVREAETAEYKTEMNARL